MFLQCFVCLGKKFEYFQKISTIMTRVINVLPMFSQREKLLST